MSPTADPRPAEPDAPTLHLNRWTIASGSNTRSRGAVVLAAGDHAWDAVAEGNGPVDALYRAVDTALAGVLDGQPRLVAYDIHAVAEGPDSEGVVTVEIAPPVGATGARARGRYIGRATSTNIIAASIEAYLEAINGLLAEDQWAGATEEAGNQRRAKGATQGRAEFDEDEGHHDTTAWFER
ncbi:MAG TPA: alpha-isopropylmalate synthase regulatory domain-containing protein [Candidatus Limnocylindrales bacterium]